MSLRLWAVSPHLKKGDGQTSFPLKGGIAMVVTWEQLYEIASLFVQVGILICAIITAKKK